MNFVEKYIKYKNKFLNLCKQLNKYYMLGGAISALNPFPVDESKIL